MLFHDIFTAVYENTNLNPGKVFQGTLIYPFLLKKGVLDVYDVFIATFNSVKSS
jgi:hypothetical protein